MLNDDNVIYEASASGEDDATIMISGAQLRDKVSKTICDGSDSNAEVIEMMDEDEAEEARRYFGVF